MELIRHQTEGSIAGEGAAFFMLGKEKSENSYAKLQGIEFIYKPESTEETEARISHLLARNGLTAADIDTVIYGINGDIRFDGTYYSIRDKLFRHSNAAYFKHLCGEYQTSGSFALWMAAMMLKKQTIPPAVLLEAQKNTTLKHIVIYNGFMGADQSVMLLSRC